VLRITFIWHFPKSIIEYKIMSILSLFWLFLLVVGFVGVVFMTWPLWLPLPKFKFGPSARFFDLYPNAKAVVATPDMFVSIAQQLARTFYRDPTYGTFFLETPWKGRVLTWFFYVDVRFRTYGNGGTVYHLAPGGATALFLNHENWRSPFLATILSFPCLLWLCAWSPSRVRRYSEIHERMEALHPQTPHTYLSLLSVDPAFQGQGLGKLVLEEELRKADESKTDVYLESSCCRNLSFYKRLGFVQNQPALKEDTALLTPMMRKPNTVGLSVPRTAESQMMKSNTGGMNSSGLTCVDLGSINEKESKTSVVESVVDTVKSAMKSVGSGASNGISELDNKINVVSTVKNVSSSVSNSMSSLSSTVSGSMSSLGSSLSNSMSSLGSSLSNSMSSLSQSISASVSSSAGSSGMSSSSSSVVGGVKQGISTVVSGIGSGISHVSSSISGIASGVTPTTSGSARQGMDLSGISSSGSSGGSSKGIFSGLFSGSSSGMSSSSLSSGFNSSVTHPGGRNYPELSTSTPIIDKRISSVSGSGMSSSGGLTRRTNASVPSAAS
jgi:GNAT superfamily N-acetyltransferase